MASLEETKFQNAILNDTELLNIISNSENNMKRLLAYKKLMSEDNKHMMYTREGYIRKSLADTIKLAYKHGDLIELPFSKIINNEKD
jgi:hypothetical protein